MPALQLLNLVEDSENHPSISMYGFEREFFTEIDNLFHDLGKEDKSLVEDEDRIRSSILRTGPCPGNARMYYHFSAQPNIPSDQLSQLLGECVSISRKEAGVKFESWVDNANAALNHWLDTESTEKFDEIEIPDSLREFYLDRIEEVERVTELNEIEKRDLKMEIQVEIMGEVFHPSEPDGAWFPQSIPGAVFESKISLPPDPVFRYEMAGYAALIERVKEQRMDYGVILQLDEEELKPEVEGFYIDDTLRRSIRDNLEKFASLAVLSMTQDEWDRDIPVKNRLVEPPEPKFDSVCNQCPYLEHCHYSGKYVELLEDSYYELSNIKLGKRHIGPILRSISSSQPHREDVKREVMEQVFPDKTEKATFRAMVVPSVKRLHLVRVGRDGKLLSLSPNGTAVFESELPIEDTLSIIFRDLTVIEFGFTENAFRFFSLYGDDVKDYNSAEWNLDDTVHRFRSQFVNSYEIDMPDEDELLGGPFRNLYGHDMFESHIANDISRRDWLSDVLPIDKQIRVDEARWRLIQSIIQDGEFATTWFVDEAIRQEYSSENSIIDLYAASIDNRSNIRGRSNSYTGILLKAR